MHLLLPKMDMLISRDVGALFYVAGPIRGGGNWQEEAYRLYEHHLHDCVIATPCRYLPDNPLVRKQIPGAVSGNFERQTDWEENYMILAATGGHKHPVPGCLMFWLPCESVTNPRPKEDGPYAQDTYGELGFWRALLMTNPYGYNLVIGAEDGFPGLHKLQRDFDRAVEGTFPMHPTLDATVAAAIEKCLGD